MENIKDENQYNEVMARIEILLREPEDNLPAMMELEKLSLVVLEYEDIHYPISRGTNNKLKSED